MGKVILLLVTLLILSTNNDILSPQGPCTYKHISFVSSVRKMWTLKMVINQHKIIMFIVFYQHIITSYTTAVFYII